MSEQLFRDVSNPSVRVGTKTWRTIPLSIVAHVVALGALVVVPLMATGVLPSPQSVIFFVAPPVVPPPPPPQVVPPSEPTAPVDVPNPDFAPPAEPSKISPEPEYNPRLSGLARADGPAVPWTGGVPGGIALTQPPAPTPPAPPEPVRPGGQIRVPTKIHDVTPVYPTIAQSAKIEGIVIIEATIGTNGAVVDARVLRSVRLLDDAALDAVRKWRFTPTLLNGVAVPVIMTVTVRFTLR